MPLVIAAATSGQTTLQATDAVTATITLPSATDTLVGKITPSFTTTIGVGNATPSASGAGITFPATQSASTDANTLDDYEEGTWSATLTPTTSGSITVGNNTGWYVKVGNLVTVGVNIFMSSVSSPVGQVTVNGLPFTSVNSISKRPAVAASGLVLTSFLGPVSGQVQTNSATATLWVNDQGNWANTIGVSSQIQFMASYVVA